MSVAINSLLGFFRFILRLVVGVKTIFPSVTLNTSRSIDQLLFTGEKRVARRTYIELQFICSRAGFKTVSARAGNCNLLIFRMNFRLQSNTPLKLPQQSIRFSAKIKHFVSIFIELCRYWMVP